MRSLEVGIRGLDRGHIGREVGPVLQEPFHALAEARHLVELLLAQRHDREERYDADDRMQLQQPRRTFLLGQLVEIEALFLVPQAAATERVHGIDDGEVVIEELAGDILVDGFRLGQFGGDPQHR